MAAVVTVVRSGERVAYFGLEHAVVSLVGESSEVDGALRVAVSASQVDLEKLEKMSGVMRVEKPHSQRIHHEEFHQF
jgi:hypothetical protein